MIKITVTTREIAWRNSFRMSPTGQNFWRTSSLVRYVTRPSSSSRARSIYHLSFNSFSEGRFFRNFVIRLCEMSYKRTSMTQSVQTITHWTGTLQVRLQENRRGDASKVCIVGEILRSFRGRGTSESPGTLLLQDPTIDLNNVNHFWHRKIL